MQTHGKLNVEVFVEPSFQENAYLAWSEGKPDCWLVDPGLPSRQTEQLVAAVQQYELSPKAILVTHGHADHIAGIGQVRSQLGDVPIVCPQGEQHMLVNAEDNLSAPMGFPITAPAPDRLVRPGEAIELGDLAWRVLDVSGHSPAGVAYYCPEAGVVFVGDALFAESIGRYDFPDSSRERLLKNIRDNLLSLADQTVVYSGHGPAATIGYIRKSNQVLYWELEQR